MAYDKLNQPLDNVERIAVVLEKLYDFISVKDSPNSARSADGKSFRHKLHHGGYLIEKTVGNSIILIYEDEDSGHRVELKPK